MFSGDDYLYKGYLQVNINIVKQFPNNLAKLAK